MDKSYIDRLKKKARDERDKRGEAAMEVVEKEYQADLRSIERLAALIAETDEGMNGKATGNGVSLGSDIGPAAALREAINKMPETFNINDLDAYITAKYPRVSKASVSSALSKVVGKVVGVKQKGVSRSPSVYYRLAGVESRMQH